jgi:hypothetical protein
MTRGPDGGATAQALNASAVVIPIAKPACDIVVILFVRALSGDRRRPPGIAGEAPHYNVVYHLSQSNLRIEI